jgi:large subunit ribosomal protein L10
MKRQDKEVLVSQLHKEFNEAKSAILVSYQGLNVAEITDLRRKLREASVDFQVVKNTMAKIASKGTSIEKMESHFQGPTAAVISKKDPVASIKLLEQFIKENPKLSLKVGMVEGAIFEKQNIMKLANLPSRDRLLAMFIGTMQAPVASFVRVFAGNISGLLNVLNGINKSKSE